MRTQFERILSPDELLPYYCVGCKDHESAGTLVYCDTKGCTRGYHVSEAFPHLSKKEQEKLKNLPFRCPLCVAYMARGKREHDYLQSLV